MSRVSRFDEATRLGADIHHISTSAVKKFNAAGTSKVIGYDVKSCYLSAMIYNIVQKVKNDSKSV